jgi:membrane protein
MPRETLDWLLQLLYTTARLFVRNGLQNHAAATAFYFMLSATPLLLLLSYGTQGLADLAESSVPASMLLAALYDQLRLDKLTEMGFIPGHTELAAGGIGLLTLLLASRGLVNTLHAAFQVIFPEDRRRGLMLSWTLPLLIIPVAFLLLGIAVGVQAGVNFFAEHALLGAGQAMFYKALNGLFSFGMIWALIFFAYWQLPMQCPPPRTTALIALLSTLSLLVLLSAFDLLFEVRQYRALYGAVGGVVFVLIGAYFACAAFYFWAQSLFALAKVDLAALEKLFLGISPQGGLERLIFGRTQRLLHKYGRTCEAGETIIREGETSRTAYFLHSGRVGLYKDAGAGVRKLAELTPGELFGEMAYLLGEPRTASVKAESEVVLITLEPDLLEQLMRHSAPLARRIIDTLSQRLQHMTALRASEFAAPLRPPESGW